MSEIKFDTSLTQTPAEVLNIISKKADEVYKLRLASEKAEADFKAAKKELLEIMLEAKVDKFTAAECIITANKKENVSCPKDEVPKKELFDYIQKTYGKEVLDNMLTINHKALTAWASKEVELRSKENLDFKVPGLSPYTTDSLGVTKRRKKKGE